MEYMYTHILLNVWVDSFQKRRPIKFPIVFSESFNDSSEWENSEFTEDNGKFY